MLEKNADIHTLLHYKNYLLYQNIFLDFRNINGFVVVNNLCLLVITVAKV